MSKHAAKLFRIVATTSRPVARLAASRLVLPPQPQTSRSQRVSIRYASSDSTPASTIDPSEARAEELMEKAGAALEDGDIESARKLYADSLEVSEGANAWFNLGVCEYQLQNTEEAIHAWEKSLSHSPSPDAHTNLASAYIMSKPPRPALSIKHLTSALELSPDDPEIAFNLAAVLESTGSLEHALKLYRRAEEGGIERAKQNIRNVSAKILGKNAVAAGDAISGTSP